MNNIAEKVEMAEKERAVSKSKSSLEKLDFLGTIKRILSETDYRPYISDFGAFRIGFLGRGIPPHETLFLTISRRESSEGLVVRLSPTLKYRDWCQGTFPEARAPHLDLFYRSRNDDAENLQINLEFFHFTPCTYDEMFDRLLRATRESVPNFELTDSVIYNGGSYFFKRLIKADKIDPIEIPWSINCLKSQFSSSIELNYFRPAPTVWRRNRHMFSLEIKLPDSVEKKSRIAVSWPRFGKLHLIYFKLRSLFYIDKTQFLPAEDFDLVAWLDAKRPPHSAFSEFRAS